MKEIWKDIKGYEGRYQISNTGKIRSLMFPNNTIRPDFKIVKTFDNGHGYEKVCLCKGNTKQRFYVHRLVATHFIINESNKDVVNHKDFNRKNNYVSNLEWVTTEENVAYLAGKNRRCLKKHKLSVTGEKYIYQNKHQMWVYIAQIKFYKHVESFEEAVTIRNSALVELQKFYNATTKAV
jgi:hypothetical protein